MPHFGFMKTEDSFKTESGAILRAKLHIRSGRRRLGQGKISDGLLTYYDALLFAMMSFTLSDEKKKKLAISDGEDLNNDRVLYNVLVRSGVLDGKFDYAAFDSLIDQASQIDMRNYDYAEMVSGIERVMTQLGVMPFDENELPAEDLSTF